METHFEIVESKKREKDIEAALQIYIATVDLNSSYTNTNQIRDHILQDIQGEERKLFFYNLYLNEKIYGFAEFGFLPNTETLIIDYICTKERNHCAFYSFYKLLIEDIIQKLEKNKKHLKYIITEISLESNKGIYLDCDSNYFRKMLSMENFSLLKYPYYQPALEYFSDVNERKFAIAIKSVSNTSVLSLNKKQYLSIVKELYFSHYGTWYKKYFDKDTVSSHLEKLIKKIEKTITKYISADNIQFVNCPIFEEGKCNNVDVQPITIGVKIKKKTLQIISVLTWFFVTIMTLIIFLQEQDDLINVLGRITSMISLLSGCITIWIFFRDFFRK